MVLAATILVAALVLLLPRRAVFLPVALLTFLTPFGAQLYAAGFHFYILRIIIFAGVLRMAVRPSSRGKLSPLEKTFCLWAFCRAVAFVALYREGGAVVNQVAFCLDAYGAYFLFRYLIQDEDDVFHAIKSLTIVATILATCMTYEHFTGINVFNLIRVGVLVIPWVRDHGVRAQGVFANSITAGCFGATLLPLFFWLWKSGKARLWGAAGIGGATLIVLTSGASTPVSAFLAGILALGLWPIRERMRTVRWGIVFTVVGLAVVMKAPVWYLLARVDFVGGHGWDRAYLVDQFVRHIPDWWMLGTKDTASWGADTWDQCNQFVEEAAAGGLVTLVLFITILSRGFSVIGRARRRVDGDLRQEWFFWCLGAALFTHVIAYLGIDYFDNIGALWYMFLAMISAATAGREIQTLSPESTTPAHTHEWFAVSASASAMGLEARQQWFSQEARPGRGAGAVQAADQ